MATAPFLLDETLPGDTDVVSQFPGVERTFRDTVEDYLNTDHDPATGGHAKASLVFQGSSPAGAAGITTLWANTGGALRYRVTTGDVQVLGDLPGTEKLWPGPRLPAGHLWEYGQAVSRTTYSELFEAITLTCTGNTAGTTAITGLSEDLQNMGLVGAYIEGTGIPTGTTISAIGSATALTLSQAASGSNTGITLRICPHGQGDGSTTFNVPDGRGRVTVGRDDMGGTSANRLTGQTGGLNGDNLVAVGGSETHTLTSTDTPTHTHTATTGASGTHTHGVQTFAVTTTASAPGSPIFGAATATGGGGIRAGAAQADGDHTHTVTVDNYGSGGAHNNVQPSRVVNFIIRY